MPFIAISYNVIPGHDDEIAEIFSERNFTRVDTPVARDSSGAEAGRNLATALFIKHDTMARIVQFEGDVWHIAQHMGRQQGVRAAERRLGPYLAAPRDTRTPEGFMQYFRNALMECLFVREPAPRPAHLAALRYRIKPQRGDAIRQVFNALHPGETLGYGRDGACPITAEGAFAAGDTMVRFLQFEGPLAGVAGYLERTGYGPRLERELAPHLADAPAGPANYGELFNARAMRVLQALSAGQPQVPA